MPALQRSPSRKVTRRLTEDLTPKRQQMIDAANTALAELKEKA